uniref:Uncharacterized protein n=1 Tax=Sphaerodactylus townsendi TaxID=933632 RepID=A0ACB8ENN6_9SAUR
MKAPQRAGGRTDQMLGAMGDILTSLALPSQHWSKQRCLGRVNFSQDLFMCVIFTASWSKDIDMVLREISIPLRLSSVSAVQGLGLLPTPNADSSSPGRKIEN